MSEIDKVLEEAKVNYEVQEDRSGIDGDRMREVIDNYYEADAEKKAAEKKMKEFRSEIESALEDMKFSGTQTFEGNEHRIQVVEKFTYELNQNKCKDCAEFGHMVSRGRLEGFTQKFTLDIVPSELDKVAMALENAGLHHIIKEIEHKYMFSGKAEDVRKLNESVDQFNIIDLFDAKRTVQISAKK